MPSSLSFLHAEYTLKQNTRKWRHVHPHNRVPNLETAICNISQWNYLAHTCIKGQNTNNYISALRLTFKISSQANIKKFLKKPMQSVLRFVYQVSFHWLIKRRTKAWKQNRERYARDKSRKKCCPALHKSTHSMRRFCHKCNESELYQKAVQAV